MSAPVHFDNAIRRTAQEIDRLQARMTAVDLPRRIMVSRRIADLIEWQAVLERRAVDILAYRGFLTAGAEGARLVGDVTPAYCLMPGPKLRQMTKVCADSRFVYLIRDPLARLWSHVRMIASRTANNDDFESVALAQLERILLGDLAGEGKGIVQRGDYSSVIPKLQRAFPPDRLLVMYQEELITPPGIQRLWTFLGLDPASVDLDRRVHEGRALAIPRCLRSRALAWLRPQYEFVATSISYVPSAWERNMNESFGVAGS